VNERRERRQAGPVLEARGVTKRFGALVALDGVSLMLAPGRVACLLGDNGAGKSTLIRILSGVFGPTAGSLALDGSPVPLRSPRHAQALGIATVHQDLGVLPLLAIWRNFFLGHEPTVGRGPLRRIDAARCERIAKEQLETLGIRVADASRLAATLSGGERQAVAIARALHLGARVLILDEPTAALGVRQSGIVLRNIERARDRGAAVLLVTHNPGHAYAVGDAFTVLRGGRVVATRSRTDVTADELAALMTGEAGEPGA